MKIGTVLLPAAGAVGIVVLMGLIAKAEEIEKRAATHSTTITVAESPLLVPAPKHKQATSAGDGVLDMGNLEMVTERYPDGKVKIEREVGQDAAGNYFNQGMYKRYSPTGEIVKTGEYINGKQHGKWTQVLAKDENHLFSASQDKQWSGPFTSEAMFQDGRLHGVWTIKDSRGQRILQWCFENGARSGTWTWYHPNSQKRLEATYVNGALNGDVLEWDQDGKVVSQNTYVDGRCSVKTVGWYTLGQKRYDGTYLRASDLPEVTYDWWNTKIASMSAAAAGHDLQHGTWTEWYPSGNKKTEAQFDRGVATGKITWWYENGQVQAEGDYEAGQRNGAWVTWHPNGLKQSLVEYKAGKQVSKAMEWAADGRLVDSREAADPNAPHMAQRAGGTR